MKFRTNRISSKMLTDEGLDEFFGEQMDILKISPGLNSAGESPKSLNKRLRDVVEYGWIKEYKARSVVYVADRHTERRYQVAYIMFDKGSYDYARVREIVENKYSLRLSKIDDLSAELQDESFYAILFNLMLGYLDNDNYLDDSELSFNNFAGRTFVFNTSRDWNDKWKEGRFKGHKKMFALEIKMTKDFLLSCKAVTFTEMTPKLAKEVIKGTPVPYEFDKLRVRATENTKPNGKYWYKKGDKNFRATIPYFNYHSLEKFKSSKLGALAKTLLSFDEKVRDYMNISHWVYDENEIKEIEVVNKKPKLNTVNYCKEQIRKVNIVNVGLTDEEFSMYAERLKDAILQRKDPVKVSIGELNERGYNLILSHNKDYYEGKGIEDEVFKYNQSHTNVIKQCMTIERMEEYMKDGSDIKNMESVLDICFVSLFIKAELKKGRMTIEDISSYGFKNPITFVIRNKKKLSNDDKKEVNYFYKIVIYPDNKLKTYSICQNDILKLRSADEKKEWAFIEQAFAKEDNGKIPDNSIEWAVYEDVKNIYICQKTEEYHMPDIKDIHKGLDDASGIVSKEFFMELLDGFVESAIDQNIPTEDVEQYRSYIHTQLEDKGDDVEKIALRRILAPNGKGHKTLYKLLTEYMEKKGLRLDAHIRNKKYDERHDRGMMYFNKGWWFRTPDYEKGNTFAYLNDTISYYVGEKQSLNQTGLRNGFPIRQICHANGSDLDMGFVNRILSMCMVDFVRLNRWTVAPFPIKYLREFIEHDNFENGSTYDGVPQLELF